jgi:tRNA (cmo5U34)-methyltransferase
MHANANDPGLGPVSRKLFQQQPSRADDLFARQAGHPGSFVFDRGVAEVFDDMVERSVPFYSEQQNMVVQLVRRYWQHGTVVVDLGCSTATTLVNVCRAIERARGVGVDNSPAMLEWAAGRIETEALGDRVRLVQADLDDDPTRLPLEGASVVTMLWTLQFVDLWRRERLMRRIHDALALGGALILAEKVRPRDGRLDQLFAELHLQLKRRNRYTETEIARKRQALEDVLVPLRVDENLSLAQRSGFAVTEPFFQWYGFASFLCLKQPGASAAAR